MSADVPATRLLDMLGAHRITAILYVATRLGVPDLLAGGPMTAGDLAARTEADERSLRRLLRALVSLEVCTQSGDDAFALTPLGALLPADAEGSLKPWAIFEGAFLARSWNDLFESVRTGKNAATLAGFHNSFEMMGRNPANVAAFNQAMAALTHRVIAGVLQAYDFAGIHKLMDVGGGYGELLSAVLRAYPAMRGAIFDLPRCAVGAEQHLAAAGVAERAEFVAGSFFESVPSGFDAIILKSIIHDWDDERSLTILGNCRRALPQGGRMLLVERLLPRRVQANAEHLSVTTSDLNMLRGPGGCERTEEEYHELLRRSGLEPTRVVSAGRWNVIESVAR